MISPRIADCGAFLRAEILHRKLGRKSLTSTLGDGKMIMTRKLGELTGGATMDKEKILAMSREENKNMDEREKLVNDQSGIVGLMCMTVMCIILFSYKAFVLGENAYDLLALYSSALMGTNLYQYKKLRKKIYLIGGLGWTFCTVGWLILTIRVG